MSLPITISYKRRRCTRFVHYDETSQCDEYNDHHDDESAWKDHSMGQRREPDESSHSSFSMSPRSGSPSVSDIDASSFKLHEEPANIKPPISASASQSQLDPLGVYYDPSFAQQQQVPCKHCHRLFRPAALIDYVRHLRTVHGVQPPAEQPSGPNQPVQSSTVMEIQQSAAQPSEPNQPTQPIPRRRGRFGRPKLNDQANVKSIVVCRICLDYRFSDEELSDHLRKEHLPTGAFRNAGISTIYECEECEFCGSLESTRRHALLAHGNSKPRLYRCPVCELRFGMRKVMRMHCVRSHKLLLSQLTSVAPEKSEMDSTGPLGDSREEELKTATTATFSGAESEAGELVPVEPQSHLLAVDPMSGVEAVELEANEPPLLVLEPTEPEPKEATAELKAARGANALRCAQCDLEFLSARALNAHCVKVHLLHQRSVGRPGHGSRSHEPQGIPRHELRLKCPHCARRFLTYIDRDLHVRAVHPECLKKHPERRAELEARIEVLLSEFKPSSELLNASAATSSSSSAAPNQLSGPISPPDELANLKLRCSMKDVTFPCEKCAQSFRSLMGLKIHVSKVHAPNPRPAPEVQCKQELEPMSVTLPIQPSSALLDEMDMRPATAPALAKPACSHHPRKQHKSMRIVAFPESFVCDTCLHECASRQELLTHIQEFHVTFS